MQRTEYTGLKRTNAERAENAQKKSRLVGDTEARIVIPNKAAGSIIGKAGHNINRLRNDYNANVTVPDCSGPERLLTVNADKDNVVTIVNDVFKGIDDHRANDTRGGQRKDDFNCKPGEADIRLLVHQSHVGAVIGKGGFKIKELKENCNCTIKVHPDVCPGSTDRVVQLIGPIDNVIQCFSSILDIIKEAGPPRGPIVPYDPEYVSEPVEDDYFPPMRPIGGGLLGVHGRSGVPPPRSSSLGFGGGLNGSFSDSRPSPLGFGGSRPGMTSGMTSFSPSGEEQEKSSTQVTIPKDMAGAIIGKGGNKIRNIRAESGAHIQIDDPAEGSTDRIITISGNSNQIWRAQYMLQQSVRDSMQGGGGKRF